MKYLIKYPTHLNFDSTVSILLVVATLLQINVILVHDGHMTTCKHIKSGDHWALGHWRMVGMHVNSRALLHCTACSSRDQICQHAHLSMRMHFARVHLIKALVNFDICSGG